MLSVARLPDDFRKSMKIAHFLDFRLQMWYKSEKQLQDLQTCGSRTSTTTAIDGDSVVRAMQRLG